MAWQSPRSRCCWAKAAGTSVLRFSKVAFDVHIRSHEMSISDPSVDSVWALKEGQAPCDGGESPVCLLLMVLAPGQNEARGEPSTNICWTNDQKPPASWSLLASPASPLLPSEKCPNSSAWGSSLSSLPLFSSGGLLLPFGQNHSPGSSSVMVSSDLVSRISLLTAKSSSLSLDYQIGSYTIYTILCVHISLQMVFPVWLDY